VTVADTTVVTWGQLRRALAEHVAGPGAVVEVYSASSGTLAVSYGNPTAASMGQAVDGLEADRTLRDAGIWVRVHAGGSPVATYAVPGRLWLDDEVVG
jgi:hypothetical protein